MRRAAVLFFVGSLVACGKSSPNGGATDGNGGGGGGGDGSSIGVITDGPPLAGTPYTITFPDIQVTSGEENTQCVWMKLSNTTEIKVHQLHNILSDVSHHLIVYKDDMDTTEQTTPMDCQPFTGAFDPTGSIEPIVITQKHDDELTLPDTVAYTLPAGQMIKLEMHYINPGEMTKTGNATVTLYAADPATISNEAGLLFTGTPDVDLAPNAGSAVHEFFQVPSYLDLSSSHIFAITGHEHQWGTGVTVNVGPSASGPFTNVYDPSPFLWNEPATATFSTPFSVPKNGGFDFTCTWNNQSSNEVKFGESANDEMCFFWAYYYPAVTAVNGQPTQGSELCAHTDQIAGGYNLCCPGDSACSFIESKF